MFYYCSTAFDKIHFKKQRYAKKKCVTKVIEKNTGLKKFVPLMRRNGRTTNFSSNSLVLLGNRETANLTFMYKLCSTQNMLLYYKVEADFLIFAFFVLFGWLD